MRHPTKRPANGVSVVCVDGKYRVYRTEVTELGALEAATDGRGRRVYATPDGRVFTDARAAAEHLATLTLQKPVD